MTSPAPETLIDTLQNPELYEHPVERFAVHETHISWVILTGPYAYKIKKPVDFGFVDFSALEKRRFYCEEELRLNRRLAPELYGDVVPITGTAQAPRLGGPGEPIEYAVRMREFPQEALLNQLLEHNALPAELIDTLAREVVEFHALIDVAPQESRFGTFDDVWPPVEENFTALDAAVEEPDRQAQIERLRNWSEREFSDRKDDFRARKRDGFVRECHGDMHLGNMIRDGERVLIFDCIEFNEDFRWVDVLSETAFVVMDLEDRGRPDFARRFLNRYLELAGDYEGMAVLPFYLTYRAMVRAKVAALRLGQQGLSDDETSGLADELHSYLDLAERYTRPPQPALVLTHGVSGSGKTTLTTRLLERFDAVRIRSDVERKRLFGLGPLDRDHAGERTDLYSAEATRRTYARLHDSADAVLQAGYTAIVDATFLKREHRSQFAELARDRHVPFRILDFEADERTLEERIERRAREGTDVSDADVEVLRGQLASREPLADAEREVAVRVRTDTLTDADDIVAELERAVS